MLRLHCARRTGTRLRSVPKTGAADIQTYGAPDDRKPYGFYATIGGCIGHLAVANNIVLEKTIYS